MSSQRSPYARFTRALRSGNLALVRAAAGELPSVRLDDALLIACLIEEQDGERYESAAVRWLGRFALECPTVRIEDLREGRGCRVNPSRDGHAEWWEATDRFAALSRRHPTQGQFCWPVNMGRPITN